jgi:hypothetical protein
MPDEFHGWVPAGTLVFDDGQAEGDAEWLGAPDGVTETTLRDVDRYETSCTAYWWDGPLPENQA